MIFAPTLSTGMLALIRYASAKSRQEASTKRQAIPPSMPKVLHSHSAKSSTCHNISRWLTATKSWVQLLGAVLVVFAVLFTTSQAWAAREDAVAVLYPDIGEPYHRIFEEIIGGVEDKIGNRVAAFPVSSNTDIDVLKTSLLSKNIKVVIALGRQGMSTAAQLNNSFKVVVGGVFTVPENGARIQPVISLTPDPALLFDRMKALMPSAKRVFVVYDPALNDWLIKMAKDAASAKGMELVAYEAQDLRSAVRFYQEIFSTANGRNDVLWLPQDSTTVEESSILPMVLQESWNKNIAVFSSNFTHVRRGILFSLYPDNAALGMSLAGLAQGILVSGDYGKRGMMALRDVQSAINLRTAKHLGIMPSRQEGFDSTFPEQ